MSTYKINPNKKTVPTINIAKVYPDPYPNLDTRSKVNFYNTEGTALDANQAARHYGNIQPNSFFQTIGDYTNSSIKYGIYVPYLPISVENSPADGTVETSDNFYTDNIENIDYNTNNLLTNSKSISKQNSFTFYNNLQTRPITNKKHIKNPLFNSPIGFLTEEELAFFETIPDFVVQNNDFEISNTDEVSALALTLSRYAAPDADSCGYCAVYQWEWSANTSYSCDPSGVPDGWTHYVSGETCGIIASGVFGTCSNHVIPTYVTDMVGDLWSLSARMVGDTYDSENECNAYNNDPATSGCYGWIPANGMSIYPVTGIPDGYVPCSVEFNHIT
jgi:hypothetical protein